MPSRMNAPRMTIAVRTAPFSVADETALLVDGVEDVGAIVSFVGVCRSEGKSLAGIELEHYPGMAEEELGLIVRDAAQRWPLQGVALIHRTGRIAVGEEIVVVIAASAHRSAAFQAADFVMDFLKTRAPFWKKELPADGSTSRWVEAKASDSEASRRWHSAESNALSNRDAEGETEDPAG